MARSLLGVNSIPTSGILFTFHQASDVGEGNGFEVPHTAQAPIILLAYNAHNASPGHITIKASPTPVNGILMPDVVRFIDSGDYGAFWLSPEHYAVDGKMLVDVDLLDILFTAARAPSSTSFVETFEPV